MSERRTIAITGAGGFVCSHIAQGLAARGHGVVALDSAFDGATRNRLSRCAQIETGGARMRAGGALSGCDTVIHGAAITTEPATLGLSDTGHIKANLALLLDALDAAESAGVADVIFLSSSGVFAPEDAEDFTTEDTVATADGPYALAKRAGEMLVCAMGGTVLRLGPLYGPHESVRPSRQHVSLVRTLCDAAAGTGRVVLDTPERRRDWTYAPDLAGVIDRLFQRGALPSGIVHCASREIVTDMALAEHILAGTGRIDRAASAPVGKAPMASIRPELADFPWTALSHGLAQVRAPEEALA